MANRLHLSTNNCRKALGLVRSQINKTIVLKTLVYSTIFISGTYDWKECLRFFAFGACVVGPTQYIWIKWMTRVFPKSNMRSAVTRALLEVVTLSPISLSSFFFSMEMMDSWDVRKSMNEVEDKLFPTWKVGLFFWPFFQTVNFSFVRPRNRVYMVALGGLTWTTFLAYMTQLAPGKRRSCFEDPKTDLIDIIIKTFKRGT